MKITLAIVGILCFVALVGRLGWHETHCVRYGSIVEVNDDEVLFEDSNGYVWAFYEDGYKVDDIVEVTFWNATTKAIEDDEIETVKLLKR